MGIRCRCTSLEIGWRWMRFDIGGIMGILRLAAVPYPARPPRAALDCATSVLRPLRPHALANVLESFPNYSIPPCHFPWSLRFSSLPPYFMRNTSQNNPCSVPYDICITSDRSWCTQVEVC